jgi:hypothetical protein
MEFLLHTRIRLGIMAIANFYRSSHIDESYILHVCAALTVPIFICIHYDCNVVTNEFLN